MHRERALLTVFLVSTCALAFEVALTRICSVLLQYHVSFAVVSMAVLGIGLGGLLGYGLARTDPQRAGTVASAALLALGPAMLLALLVLLRLPFARHWPGLLFLVLPAFAAAGAFQSLVLRALAERVGRLYAADLAGGAAGSLLAVLALDALGGPVNAALVLAVLAAGVAWMWTRGGGGVGRLAPVGLAVALAAVAAQRFTGFLDVDFARAPHKLIHLMMQPGPAGWPALRPELGRWDATSRVDVLELASLGGTQRLVFIDGETPTPMLRSDPVAPNAGNVAIDSALAALPFRLQAPRSVLSIGSGGGYDVVLARRFGAQRVDAVELNAGVLETVAAARAFTGDVYGQPGVRLHHAEGRQFVRRAPPGTYDLVIMALAQSLAGNLREYALSENYLYTREAFDDYLRALRPGGALALLVSNSLVERKLLRTSLEVLSARGLPAESCVAALSSRRESPYDHLVLVRTAPFGGREIEILGQEVRARGYDMLHVPPGVTPPGPQQTPATLSANRRLRLEPASDDRPFFFNLERGAPGALGLLAAIAAVLLVLTWVPLLAWPALRDDATGERIAVAAGGGPRPRFGSAGAYFVVLGLAFMMVEVLVLQKTILVIGFPTLNLGLVLAVFLVAAGCGSAMSTRLQTRGALGRVLVVLGAALLCLVPLLDLLRDPLERLPLALRCVALGAALFPFGFAMGMPFPTGVRLLPRPARDLIPWFWGLNGIASILGSAIVIGLVLQVGFRISAVLPALLYGLCPVLVSRWPASPQPAAPGTTASQGNSERFAAAHE